MANNTVKINLKQTGRVRGPNLSDPALRQIGTKMVAAQLARWKSATNADGQPAKPLKPGYIPVKKKVRGISGTPVRDMQLTYKTIPNFTLRKAAVGRIRAENTTQAERKKALRANKLEQMIGFALTDFKAITAETQYQYGQYAKTAFIPMGGTRKRP